MVLCLVVVVYFRGVVVAVVFIIFSCVTVGPLGRLGSALGSALFFRCVVHLLNGRFQLMKSFIIYQAPGLEVAKWY